MIVPKRFTFNWFFDIITISKSGIVIMPITRCHQASQGNQRKPFVSYLRRLFVTGYSRVLRCYEWLSYKNHSRWGNMLKSWEFTLKQFTNGFTRVGSRWWNWATAEIHQSESWKIVLWRFRRDSHLRKVRKRISAICPKSAFLSRSLINPI